MCYMWLWRGKFCIRACLEKAEPFQSHQKYVYAVCFDGQGHS